MKSTAGLLLFTLSFLPLAHAGTLALDITGLGSSGSAGPQSLGWEFQVNQAIWVDGLAFWDHTDTQSHDVGIYNDSTQALLVSTSVLPGDPQIGTAPWRVHAITPVFLAPGTYDIAAETGSDNYTYNPGTMTTDPSITFVQDRFLFGSNVLAYPNQSSAVVGWFGPSFTFSPSVSLPEPASAGLFGGGLIALAIFSRRLRRRV